MRKIEDRPEVSSEKSVCAKRKCCSGMGGKLVVVVVIIILAAAGFYAWKMTAPRGANNQAQADKMVEEQTRAIVAKVGRLMVLPSDELPQIAEIKDAALAAKEQPSLAGSQNGDILLIYAKASKAILYSPSKNVVVNVIPVQMGNPAEAQPVSALVETPAKNTTSTKK